MWYREGTLTLVKDSSAVTGEGTNWSKTENGVLPGMILLGPDGSVHEIKSVQSNTALTLVEAYTGETAVDAPCRIITTYEGDISQFSARFSAMLQRMTTDSGVIRAWLTSGKTANLITETGEQITIKSLLQIVDEHDKSMSWFESNRAAIDAAGDKAKAASQSAAEAAAYQIATQTSEANALDSANKAEASAGTAAVSEVNAGTSASNAKASETSSEASEASAARSAKAASLSEANALNSMNAAANSEANAENSEAKAYSSEVIAVKAKEDAVSSASTASRSASEAKVSEANAQMSEQSAKAATESAAASQLAAAGSEAQAIASERNASASASAAKSSETNAGKSEAAAEQAANKALTSEKAASRAETAAATSEVNSKSSESNAATAAANAAASEASAAHAKVDAENAASVATAKAESASASEVSAADSASRAEAAASKSVNGGQPYSEILTSISALGDSTASDQLMYLSDKNQMSLAPIAVFMRDLLSKANADALLDAIQGTDKTFLFADSAKAVALPGDLVAPGSAVFNKGVTAGYTGGRMFAQQYGTDAAFYQDITTTGTSEFHPLVKQRVTVGDKSWSGSFGWLINSMEWHLLLIDKTAQEQRNFVFRTTGEFTAPGRILPGDYANFDVRYLGLNANAVSATKLLSARKIAGKAFDGTSDVVLTADDVGAVTSGLTATVIDDTGVPWNGKTGVYNGQRSGDSVCIAHFNTNTGSCPSLQLKAHYKNGGLFYRSSRDQFGFEQGFEQIYTTSFKPSPADIGALPNNGGVMAGQMGVVSYDDEALYLQRRSANQALYLRGRAENGAARWYVGNGSSGADDVTLGNYIHNTTLTLNESGVVSNRGYTANGYFTAQGSGTTTLIMGTGGGDAFLKNTTSGMFLQLKNNGLLSYSDQPIYHSGNKPTPAELGAYPTSGGELYGEVITTSANGYRIKAGNYGMFIRNDGANTYFLLTNAGDQNGGWNNLRPFYFENSSGVVYLGQGVNVSGFANFNGLATLNQGVNVYGSANFNGAMNIAGSITIPTNPGAWINMRTGSALQGTVPLATGNAAPIVRQEHPDRDFVLGGLGNSQFGIYGFEKSRTENGYDYCAYLDNGGNWTASGYGSFNDVYIRSDRRNKRNIKKIDGALDKLEKIDGVLYELQGINGYSQSAGLVAQQFQDVQPELVTSDIDHISNEERLRLNYNGVIGMLVEAVKELRAEVREIKEAIA